MKWVTRERPKFDRIACRWLIARFIDEAPEFLYVPAAQVLETADQTGAVFMHEIVLWRTTRMRKQLLIS